MRTAPWISVGQFGTEAVAHVVATNLTISDIPNKVVRGAIHDPRWYVWVPPEWIARAKEVIGSYAVPESELEAQALGYPPPDDA